MITIFDKSEMAFEGIGLSVLCPTKCVIDEELNGEYELTMTHPRDNWGKWKYLENQRIIMADTPTGRQPFRIYRVNPDEKEIKVNASHIFYDLNDNFCNYAKMSGTAKEWIEIFKSKFLFEMLFDFSTNLENEKSVSILYEDVSPVEILLGSNGFIENFGGEILRDFFDVQINAAIGSDSGYTIRYGKNLVGLEVDEDLSDTYTRARAYGKDGVFKQVDSPRINDYVYPKIKTVTFSNAITREDLEAAVLEAYKNGADLPRLNIKVDFVQLEKTEDYKDYKFLKNVKLGDTVTVYNPKMNFNKKSKVVSYSFDAIQKTYNSIQLGELRAVLTTNITNTNANINKLTGNVLQKDNTIPYTPTDDYNPATVKYVKEMIGGVSGDNMAKSVYDTNNRNTDIFNYTDEAKSAAVDEVKDWTKEVYSNPNILINGGFDVWQRDTDFDLSINNRHMQYTCDRWFLYHPNVGIFGNILKNENGGIHITNTLGISFILSQILDFDKKILNGKKCTLSIKVSNLSGVLSVYFEKFKNVSNFAPIYKFDISKDGIYEFNGQYNDLADYPYYGICIECTNLSNVIVEWVKLEFGDIATPYIPQHYSDTLAQCQRYTFIQPVENIVVSGFSVIAIDENTTRGSILFPKTMRISPTISDIILRNISTGTIHTVKSFQALKDNNGINAIYNLTFAEGVLLTKNDWYSVTFDADAEIY